MDDEAEAQVIQNVPKSGYEWVRAKGQSPDEWFLVKTPTRGQLEVKEVDLMGENQLYTDFAQLSNQGDIRRENILDFANTYGRLGPQFRQEIDIARGQGFDETESRPAELLATWERQIKDFNRILNLWKAVQDDRLDRIDGRIHRKNELFFYEDPTMNWANMSPEQHNQFLSEDRKGAIRAHIEWSLNFNNRYSGRMYPKVFLDDQHERFSLRYFPTTLYGTIWFQMVRAVAEEHSYKTCAAKGCSSLIPIGPNHNRSSRKFCPDGTCRQNDYHRRKKKAISLDKEGLDVDQIAEEIPASRKESIKTWIAE